MNRTIVLFLSLFFFSACSGDGNITTSDAGASPVEDTASAFPDVVEAVDTGPGDPCDPAKLEGVAPPSSGDCNYPEWPNCVGAQWPEYILEDFQPASARLGESYGRDGFEGHVTFLSLLSATCHFCQLQAAKMEEMMKHFEWEGMDIKFVGINSPAFAASSAQKKLYYMIEDSGTTELDEDGNPVHRCTFPLLQDTDEVDAWNAHDGRKSEIYIYGSNGVLKEYFATSEDVKASLSDPDGYAKIMKTVRRAWCDEQ
jgi:hypothetical protein